MPSKQPCYKCENRTPECHSTCKKYLAYNEKMRAAKKIVDDKKNIERYIKWRSRVW